MEAFPSLYEKWSVHLSVVIPAYNEEERCKYLFINNINYKNIKYMYSFI